MIVCYINGKPAVPTLQSSIKLTRENPFVKSKDSYTYDITFPMSIPENRLVFGPLNRLDTTKSRRKYDDCILMADNVTVIRGVGTVTSVTQTEVKLQILSGGSSLRYRSDFERVYIDRITYPSVPAKYQTNCTSHGGVIPGVINVDSEVRNKGYIGDRSLAVFMPVWDASNDRMANELLMLYTFGADWPQEQTVVYGLINRAVQPNFMMVVRRVLEHMGYTVAENAYDTAPWNELVICSARQTAIIAKALPHWTVQRFLDEFRYLFNAVLVFDETVKEVRILRADQAAERGTVTYETGEEFTSNYDEDGLEYLSLSNIRYKLSGYSDIQLEVPDDVIQNFDIREFDSSGAMVQAFDGMTEQQKLTTLMVDPGGYCYGHEAVDAQGKKTGSIELKRFGQFTKIIRDSQSDNDIELSICPVGFEEKTFNIYASQLVGSSFIRRSTDAIEVHTVLPVVDNSEVLPEDGAVVEDTDERPYVTIEDVVEAGISAKAEEDEDETIMELMWAVGANQHPIHGTDNVLPLRIPGCGVDWRMGPVFCQKSLALSHASGYPYIGQFHGNALKVNCGGSVDGNDELCIPFLCDGIPDPTLVYNFNGKRYLCSKIEVVVTGDGIDRMKTGYFYEMLE